ncbi:hypothetical protein [Streptomyces sp. ME19-01-6]|uniref:hypothetical protein n=1 Tax=Streptomyces sp. ME19-01-6 TaxID=3028686 RepID=UPI0029B97DA2|nr:hypothetical protein [Streptomyces sp. ME19-01-6]MDX3225823.1 hypothetical protein [Streptomyces sp. ME19-01-6]
MKRGLTTAVAAVAIMAGVAGCTSGGSDASDGSEGAAQHLSAAKACDDGTYTWFNVSQRSVLTDMKPGRHVEKGEKVSTKEVAEVARYTRSVRTDGADLSPKAVIRALAEHLKLSDRLVGDGSGPDEPTTKYDSSVASGERKAEASGRYVPAREVDLVEADFHDSCEDSSFQDAAVSGHVVTWQTPTLFVVACGEKPEKNRSQGEREAARLGCREGDPARA